MTKVLSVLVVLTLTVIIAASCSKDNDNGGSSLDCSTVAKSFTADVNPTIQATCNISGCHATGSTNGPGPLTNYTQVFNARSAIRTAVANGRMPQGSSLSTSQKNSILCWIDSGAPNN
jgi:hypothetical protein